MISHRRTLILTGFACLLMGAGFVSGFVYGTRMSSSVPAPQTIITTIPRQKSPETVAPTASPAPPLITSLPETQTPSVLPATRRSVAEVTYTLPSNWQAHIKGDVLDLKPSDAGGYIFVHAYTYDGVTGRREFFCGLPESYCISSTRFDPITVGNLTGYAAVGLDASGSGPVYFGVRNGVFYVINTLSPYYSFESDAAARTQALQGVLQSLRFP